MYIYTYIYIYIYQQAVVQPSFNTPEMQEFYNIINKEIPKGVCNKEMSLKLKILNEIKVFKFMYIYLYRHV
jgi:hypothetical protein